MASITKDFVVKSGLQAGGTIKAPASTTAAASINLPHGSAPTSPLDGDMWTTSSNFFVRINGATASFVSTAVKLNVFQPTTSSELASVISDETGTAGKLVFSTTPTFSTSVLTDSISFDVFDTTATTINAFGAASTLDIGAATGTITINNPTVTLSGATTLNMNGANPTIATTATGTLTFFNTNLATVNSFATVTALTIGGTTATSTINIGTGATINTATKTINIGTAGVSGSTTNINLGSAVAGATGTLTVGMGTVVGVATTQNVFNTVATTVAAFGAATTLGLGAATGTATINNATVTFPNATTINVNGAAPTIASTATGTLTLFNANITGVNAFQAATSVSIGASTGTFTIGNATVTMTNAATVNVNGANPTLASTSTGTLALFNTNLLTVNAFGAATSLSMATATTATTINLGTGATANGVTKAINIGTAGVSGSTTNINIGSAVAGALGTTTIGSPTLVGTNTTQAVFNTVATTVNAFGAATTLSLGAGSGTTTVNNNLTVSGNLTVNGTTTTINATTMTVDDIILTLGGDTAPVSDDAKDRGIEFRWYSGSAKVGFFGFDRSTGYFTFIQDATNTAEVFSGTQGTLEALQYRSTATTGTPPFVVASTDKVVNLNADLLDGLDSTAFVGVNNPTFTGVLTSPLYTTNLTTTINTVSATTIVTLPAATYRSADVVISMTQGTKYTVTKALITHNGTDAYITEYGVTSAATGDVNYVLSANVSGGNLLVQVTSSDANTTNVVAKAAVMALNV